MEKEKDADKIVFIGDYFDNYGDGVTQSPIWVRPRSLSKDKLDGFIHVVGHTMQEKLSISDEIILIDTLGTTGEYLIWDNFKISVGRI